VEETRLLLLLLLLFGDDYHLPTPIVATIRADPVGFYIDTAVGTADQRRGGQLPVGAALALSLFGDASFG